MFITQKSFTVVRRALIVKCNSILSVSMKDKTLPTMKNGWHLRDYFIIYFFSHFQTAHLGIVSLCNMRRKKKQVKPIKNCLNFLYKNPFFEIMLEI